MAYPTTAELVAASTVEALTGLEEAQQDAQRAEAIAAVEGFCHQSFESEGTEGEPATRTLDGTGARELYLPKRLSQLMDLTVTGGAFTETDVVLSDQGDRLHLPDETAGATWATRAIAEATGYREIVFPAGNGTVTVKGVWGWADAEYPAAITTALRWDMEDRALANAHALSETVRSARALGLSGVDQGGLSIALDGHEPQVSVRVARLLRRASDPPLVWAPATGALA